MIFRDTLRGAFFRLTPLNMALLALGGATLVAVASLSAQATAQETPPAVKASMTVTVSQPQTASWMQSLSATGEVAAWQEAVVGAETGGLRIAQVTAQVGDWVKKGQVLAELAIEGPSADLAAAQAAVAQAQAAHQYAASEAARVRELGGSAALSESQKFQFITQERITETQLHAAQAQLKLAQLRLSQTKVLAPDAGVISARQASVGAVVGTGQELFRLLRQNRLEWRAEVTAAEVGRVKLGQKVQVKAPSGATVEGTVRAIAPTANSQTRAIVVFVDLPKHADFKAGMFANGQFNLGQTPALTVPTQAVVNRDGHHHVFVVGDDQVVQMVRVTTGRQDGTQVEIRSGLRAEQRVAVKGAGFLNDGDLVKVVQ